MRFKIKDVELSVRTILTDTDSDNESFTSKEIYLAIRDGIKKINQLRPESRYVNNLLQGKIITNPQFEEIDFVVPESYEAFATFADNYVNMEDTWQEPLVNFVVSMMFQKNDADTINTGLSGTYYQLFKDGIA